MARLPTIAEQPVNNSGNISFNIRVPDAVEPGTRTVTVMDVAGRVGVVDITVAKPEITLDPAESLVGSEVTVSGTGFPANDLVLIKYAENTVDTAATSSTGTFEQIITVPSGNDPGASPEVEAVAQVQDVDPGDEASAKTKHKLPDAVITLSPSEANAGGVLTINGANYNGFRQVSLIEVGGNDVTPVPAPSTDKWGTFSATVQVPPAHPGPVRCVGAGWQRSRRFGHRVLPGRSGSDRSLHRPPRSCSRLWSRADRLTRVWTLDRSIQKWLFYDPDPDFASFNTMDMVPATEPVTIIINEGPPIEFQDKTLFEGSNPVSLD